MDVVDARLAAVGALSRVRYIWIISKTSLIQTDSDAGPTVCVAVWL